MARVAQSATERVETILAEWRPGSGDWDWVCEWADITECGGGLLARLIRAIAVNGITEPVLLGDDGRVWDGHHRLMIAHLLSIEEVPVEFGTGGSDAREVRQAAEADLFEESA